MRGEKSRAYTRFLFESFANITTKERTTFAHSQNRTHTRVSGANFVKFRPLFAHINDDDGDVYKSTTHKRPLKMTAYYVFMAVIAETLVEDFVIRILPEINKMQ